MDFGDPPGFKRVDHYGQRIFYLTIPDPTEKEEFFEVHKCQSDKSTPDGKRLAWRRIGHSFEGLRLLQKETA